MGAEERLAELGMELPEPPPAARNALRDRAAKVRAEGMAAIADAIVAAGTSDDTKVNHPSATAYVRESIMGQPAEGYARACEALSALNQVAVALFASVIVAFISGAPITALLSWSNGPHHREISLSFGSDDVATLFIACTVLVIARVMAEAQRVADENAKFV